MRTYFTKSFVAFLRSKSGDFDEAKHPRDDSGKFGSVGSGGETGKEPQKEADAKEPAKPEGQGMEPKKQKGPFTVRKLQPGEIVETVELPNGRSIKHPAPASTTYAVVDGEGKVVRMVHPVTGKPHGHQMWPNKKTAERQAEMLSKQESDESEKENG